MVSSNISGPQLIHPNATNAVSKVMQIIIIRKSLFFETLHKFVHLKLPIADRSAGKERSGGDEGVQ